MSNKWCKTVWEKNQQQQKYDNRNKSDYDGIDTSHFYKFFFLIKKSIIVAVECCEKAVKKIEKTKI